MSYFALNGRAFPMWTSEPGVGRDKSTALTRLMETRTGAADTAARWWAGRGINRVVDTGDLEAVRRAVNGGTKGLAEFRAAYARGVAG